VTGILQKSYDNTKNYKFEPKGWTTSEWMEEGFKSPREIANEVTPARKTGVSVEKLKVFFFFASFVVEAKRVLHFAANWTSHLYCSRGLCCSRRSRKDSQGKAQDDRDWQGH